MIVLRKAESIFGYENFYWWNMTRGTTMYEMTENNTGESFNFKNKEIIRV